MGWIGWDLKTPSQTTKGAADDVFLGPQNQEVASQASALDVSLSWVSREFLVVSTLWNPKPSATRRLQQFWGPIWESVSRMLVAKTLQVASCDVPTRNELPSHVNGLEGMVNFGNLDTADSSKNNDLRFLRRSFGFVSEFDSEPSPFLGSGSEKPIGPPRRPFSPVSFLGFWVPLLK